MLPRNFNVKVRKSDSHNYPDGLWYQLDVTRSNGVKVLVIVVIWTFCMLFPATHDLWLLMKYLLETSGLVGISILCIATAYVMYPRSAVEGMYVVPVATLFAFTSLRANLPGAPAGFGVLFL